MKKLTIFYPNEPMISLYVASACQLSCQECIMLSLMKNQPKYQMGLDEVENLLSINEESNYEYHYRLTGGEPFLWKHFEDGIKLIRKSKSCLTLSVITNAINIKKVTDEMVDLIDCIRISKYKYNHENTDALSKKYPNKVLVVDRETFCKNPTEPVPNSTPVECGNPEIMFYNNKIFACPHSESIAIKFGMTDLELSKELKVGYRTGLFDLRHGHEKLCELCIGNAKVRNAMAKVPNRNANDKEETPKKKKKFL